MTRGETVMIDARSTTETVKPYIRHLGGMFMKSAGARNDAEEVRLRGFPYYFGGRGSVLGTVDAEVVAAVFGFFPRDFVRTHWTTARGAMPPDEFERRYVETCRAWGRDRLHDFPHADRLAELLWLVAGSADISATPLFAGWRAVPLPDDPPARVAQLAHVLREHRGGLHLVAVLANGLTPLEAVLTRGQGSERARFLGWPKPYPSMSEAMHKRRTEVEQLTDDLAAPAYASLGVDQLAELHRLAEQAYRTVLAERRS